METKEIIGLLMFIPLILAIIYFPKFFKTPNMKLNYIIGKYRLKSYTAKDLKHLLKEDDKKVPQRDKDLINELLKDKSLQ